MGGDRGRCEITAPILSFPRKGEGTSKKEGAKGVTFRRLAT
jgi:hypothetical protein